METSAHNMKFQLDEYHKSVQKVKNAEAEKMYYERQSGCGGDSCKLTPLAGEVAKARQMLQQVKDGNQNYENNAELSARLNSFDSRLSDLEKLVQAMSKNLESVIKQIGSQAGAQIKPISTPAPKPDKAVEDDDDVDLFGSDSEDDETANKIREERLAAYAEKKSKKPAVIAKSNIILDIKPWDDETDMKQMESEVRKITMEGLVWGASKLVPLAYGIHKLQISCVVEDDKVSIDLLQETIQELEDFVQSVDIAAFNKI